MYRTQIRLSLQHISVFFDQFLSNPILPKLNLTANELLANLNLTEQTINVLQCNLTLILFDKYLKFELDPE